MIEYADLIGAPFKSHGRDIKTGVDCYGLVQEVFRREGIELPEFDADYNDCKKINAIVRGEEERASIWRRLEVPKVPCIVTISFGVARSVINHIGGNKFIHLRENIGVCVDDINSPAWRKIIHGYYEYIGKE